MSKNVKANHTFCNFWFQSEWEGWEQTLQLQKIYEFGVEPGVTTNSPKCGNKTRGEGGARHSRNNNFNATILYAYVLLLLIFLNTRGARARNRVNGCASLSSKRQVLCTRTRACHMGRGCSMEIYTARLIRPALLLMIPHLCGCMSSSPFPASR